MSRDGKAMRGSFESSDPAIRAARQKGSHHGK